MANTFQTFEPASDPPFLNRTYGKRWAEAFGITKDQLMSYVKFGIAARFPTLAPLDALGLIGTERGIVQGVSETTEDYVNRILNAWGEWTIGGTYWGILAQLAGLGYTTAYVVAANGFIYGPSGIGADGLTAVSAPDPINGVAGNPPTWTQLPGYYTASGQVFPPWNFGGGDGQGQNASPSPFTVDPPTFPSNTTLFQNGGPPDPTGNFWSRYLVMIDPYPASWTSVSNPPTATSAPSAAEIATIQEVIALFGPGKATCTGILAINGTARGCWAWPLTNPGGSNIIQSCWLTRAIITGGAPSVGNFDVTHNQTVGSWLPKQAVSTAGGHTLMWTMPSFKNFNGYVYSSPGPTGTTGLVEPTWPTTIGNTVSDNGITWTCEMQVHSFSQVTGSVCFEV